MALKVFRMVNQRVQSSLQGTAASILCIVEGSATKSFKHVLDTHEIARLHEKLTVLLVDFRHEKHIDCDVDLFCAAVCGALNCFLCTLKREGHNVDVIETLQVTLDLLNEVTSDKGGGSVEVYALRNAIHKSSKQSQHLLDILTESEEAFVHYDVILLLQKLYSTPVSDHPVSEELEAGLLKRPDGIGKIIQCLQQKDTDFLRNEALKFLSLILKSNLELQKIAAFQGCIETLLWIVAQEQQSDAAGIVTRHCLVCTKHILQNPYCRKYIRETQETAKIVEFLEAVLTDLRVDDSKV